MARTSRKVLAEIVEDCLGVSIDYLEYRTKRMLPLATAREREQIIEIICSELRNRLQAG